MSTRFLVWASAGVLVAALAAVSTRHLAGPKVSEGRAEALLAAGLYERAETAAAAELDARRAAEGRRSLPAATAADVLVRARVLNGRGTDASTLRLARETLAIEEEILGRDHAGLAGSLINLADLLVASADYEQAVATLERAVRLRERAGQERPTLLAETLDHYALALSRAGQHDTAIAAFERSRAIKEAARVRPRTSLVRTLEGLALVLQRKGDYGRSADAIQTAVAIQEADASAHPDFVGTLNILAQQYWFEGDLPRSKETSERAVAAAERTLRPDHPTMARSLRYLAGTLSELGELTRSYDLKQRALAIAERTFGPNHYETGEYLNDLAIDELYQGLYPTARSHFERARGIFEARLRPSHDYVATVYHNLAIVDARLGDYADARREQAHAIAIWEHVLGGSHPFVAIALTELATVYGEQGSPAEAIPLLERALAIREQTVGARHRDTARTLVDLAQALNSANQTARAQQLSARALGIWAALNEPDSPDYATVLDLSAGLQLRAGDRARAIEYYEKALAIRAKAFGPSHPRFAETQVGLARALALVGDHTAALRTASRAEGTGREHLRLTLRWLPERQSLNYAATRPGGLDVMLSLTALTSTASGMALDAVIRSRALVLDEMAIRHHAVAGEALDADRAAFAAAQQRFANLLVRGPGQQSASQYTAIVDDARRQSESAERVLAERSVEFKAERVRAQLGLDDVKAALPARTALISFVRYERMAGLASRAVGDRLASPVLSYMAFVVRPDRQPVAIALESAHIIEALVARWRADVDAQATRRPSSPSISEGVALRQAIWDPLTPHLADVDRLFIVPDGALSLVPFAALPVDRSSYLLERTPVIHYVSAERDLVPSARARANGRGLLALGGASFDDPTAVRHGAPSVPTAPRSALASAERRGTACRPLQAIRFEPLAGTEQEVGELSQLWNDSSRDEAEPVSVLVERDASEQAFKREAPHSRILHLATHGFFLSGECSPDTPAATRGVGGLASAGSPASAARSDNPLLLSGLALAGANHRGAAGPDEDDGILTAQEVASLDLTGTEWAVLSACDTGLGEIKAGEGVLGLRRAFQIAGARTVIMSLWSVDDQSTRAWMHALYAGRLRDRLDTADAVRAASLSVLHERRAKGLGTHPFYWAAFVAAGDWR